MKPRDLPAYVRDTVLRMFPHRARTGLVAIGNPDRQSPVLLTGNFTLTVRRLRDVLSGRDAWLLIANSKGINVWCAASGGHLTHHDVIAAIRTSRLEGHVDHREIVLPQLCATGVERSKITQATGFTGRWGPARLEDLPAFLARGRGVQRSERLMRFPLWERLEMATMWYVPMALVVAPIISLAWGGRTMGASAVGMAAIVFGLFGLLPWLPIWGRVRWLVFLAAAVVSALLGGGLLALLGAATPWHVTVVGAACLLGVGVLSVDLAGTTPWYGSYINTFHNQARIELVEERCTGTAECVQVCPRDVLQMNGKRRKVEIGRPGQCIQCGACIVQCPEDALRFHYDDDRIVEATTIRRTRMNMLGRRSVQVRD